MSIIDNLAAVRRRIDAAAQAGQAATGVADAQYQQMVGMGQDLQADVSGRVDQSINRAQQAYDDYKAQEASKEQRSASHILIEVNDDRSDEERGDLFT